MSADNGLFLNLKTFEVNYYQGEDITDTWQCKTLEQAIKKVQAIEKKCGGTEYGCHFLNKL